MLTTYRVEGGPERTAHVVLGGRMTKRRRRCLRDRIAKMNLDLINPDLAAAFDNPAWAGMDFSDGPDLTATWVFHAGTVAEIWKKAAERSGHKW